MRIDRILLGLAACYLTSASAFAADYDITNDAAFVETYGVSDFDWTGFYVGAFAGYTGGEATNTLASNGAFPTNVPLNGGMVGVTVGGNYQLDQFVLGLEGNVAWNGASGSTSCTGTASQCSGELQWNGDVKARLGVAVDNLLLFANGGVAFGGIKGTSSPALVGSTGTDTQTFVGWTAGLGAEYAFTENLRAVVEYSYTDFGTKTSAAGTLSSVAVNTDPYAHSVKAGLNFAF